MPDKQERPVRIRTASVDKRKALEHYQELRRAGKSKRAVVISEGEDGHITILGQMLKPDEIGTLLLVAADALAHADRQRTIAKLEVHQEPVSVGETVGQTVPESRRGVTKAPDGTLLPPKGETISSCGVCHHPRWYVLLNDQDDKPSRFACAHCGNEVILHRIHHQEGHA